jgi:hypothetical protein
MDFQDDQSVECYFLRHLDWIDQTNGLIQTIILCFDILHTFQDVIICWKSHRILEQYSSDRFTMINEQFQFVRNRMVRSRKWELTFWSIWLSFPHFNNFAVDMDLDSRLISEVWRLNPVLSQTKSNQRRIRFIHEIQIESKASYRDVDSLHPIDSSL